MSYSLLIQKYNVKIKFEMNYLYVLLSFYLLQQTINENILTMKQFFIATLMTISFALAANTADPVEHTNKKSIKTDESSVAWTGKKVTGQHTGTINIKSGNLEFDHGKLVGGMITIDMNSIKCTDLKAGGATKLEGHLKSDDFFGVPNFPTSELKVTKTTAGATKGSYNVEADLTIKGITKPVTFTAEVGKGETNAKIIIDRTDYDVRYGSGSFFDDLGDKTIYDDFELVINLKY